MRRIFAVFITAILLFNTVVFADEAANIEDKEVLAAFFVNPEFGEASAVIKLSELSRASALSFSYNPETGLLFAEDGEYGVFIRELDDNVEVNDSELIIRDGSGMQLVFPYRFKVFTYICRQNEGLDRDYNILDPRSYFEGKANVSALAEASLELDSGKVRLVLRKLGTSNQTIDTANIDEFLGDNLRLVNKDNTLERDFTPSGLIYSKPAKGRATVNLRLDGEATLQLNHMLEAAYNEGISGMLITSAFRTFDKQTSLFNNKTSILSRKMNRKTAMEEASKIVAVPGASEHQTGLAVDICSEGVGLIRSFNNTPQGKWLADNSWRFGFIIRYPMEKTDITGIIYEPWHVRYVGSEHSEIMRAKNMCLEEYAEYLKENRITYFNDSKGDNYAIHYIDKEDFSSSDGMTLSLQENSTWNISNLTKDSFLLTIKL